MPPPDSNHSRQPTFWTRLGAGWVSGAVGELVWGHPFSTAMVHLENPEARRLLASHRSLFQSLSGLLFKSNDRRPPTASELARTGRLLIRQQGLEGLWRGASLPVVAGSLAAGAAFAAYGEARAALLARFPALRRARPVVARLGPGDVLFCPPEWWHTTFPTPAAAGRAADAPCVTVGGNFVEAHGHEAFLDAYADHAALASLQSAGAAAMR